MVKKNRIKITKKDFGSDKKGRKGSYYYVKEKGKIGKYYKSKDNLNEKDYIKWYKSGIISKKSGVNKERLNKEKKYAKLSKKYPNIEQELKEGYAEYTIQSGKNLSPQTIQSAYRGLLISKTKTGQSLVNDKELIDVLIRPENIEKWKHRILFEIGILDQKGDKVSQIVNTKIKSLIDIKKDILEKINIGMEVGMLYRNLDSEKMLSKGYRITYNKREGKINGITIKMVFRKGK